MKEWLYNPLLRIPHFDILGDDGSIYLRRFFLLGSSSSGSTGAGKKSLLPFRLYLHEIRRSDSDKCPHNHPWWFWSLILWGGYTEAMYDSTGRNTGYFWRQPGSLRYCGADTIHQVRLDVRWMLGATQCFPWTSSRMRRVIMEEGHPERTAWTLILAGPRVQEWGFFTRSGFVQWREFLGKSKDVRDQEC